MDWVAASHHHQDLDIGKKEEEKINLIITFFIMSLTNILTFLRRVIVKQSSTEISAVMKAF